MARWKTSAEVRTVRLPNVVGYSKADLLEDGQGVGAQPEPQRLKADDALRGDVAQVHVRADPGDQVGLQGGGGRLEEQAVDADARMQHVLDQAVPELAVG